MRARPVEVAGERLLAASGRAHDEDRLVVLRQRLGRLLRAEDLGIAADDDGWRPRGRGRNRGSGGPPGCGATFSGSGFTRVGSIIPSTVSTTRRPSAGFFASRPVSSDFGSSKTHECSSATSVWSALRPPISADSPNEVPGPTCATTRSAPASLTETRRKRPRYTRSIPESGWPARTMTVPAGDDAGREPVGDLGAGLGGERLQQFVRCEERSPGVLRDVGHRLAEDDRRVADLDAAAGHERRPLDPGAVDGHAIGRVEVFDCVVPAVAHDLGMGARGLVIRQHQLVRRRPADADRPRAQAHRSRGRVSLDHLEARQPVRRNLPEALRGGEWARAAWWVRGIEDRSAAEWPSATLRGPFGVAPIIFVSGRLVITLRRRGAGWRTARGRDCDLTMSVGSRQ